ncbi:MAG: response regulator [Burkholderiales bacterium]|nr:response regulator [Burkholderiales bacterium]
MTEALRLLLLEDVPEDAELITRALRRGGFDVVAHRVDDERGFLDELERFLPQLVLSDFSLPGFSGLAALEMLRSRRADIPFIFVSGTIGEERAIDSLQRGAMDYVLKTNLARLAPAVRRALDQVEERSARQLAESELADANQRLRMLSKRLIRAQESERSRIARELHDELGQTFTALKIQLQSVSRRLGTSPLAPDLTECIGVVDQAIGQVRALSLDLRPASLDHAGLASALRWHVERVSRSAGIPIEFDAADVVDRVDGEVETACFRIAQETLTNVLRHAEAQRVRIELRFTRTRVTLRVSDDGRGFDLEEAQRRGLQGLSAGLLGLHERAQLAGGALRIDTTPGAGTMVTAVFPRHPEPPAGSA